MSYEEPWEALEQGGPALGYLCKGLRIAPG